MSHFGNIYCFIVSVPQNETFCHLLEIVPNLQMFSDSAKMRFGVVLLGGEAGGGEGREHGYTYTLFKSSQGLRIFFL